MSEPILPVGKQSGICVHDGSEWRKAKGDADGHAQVDVLSSTLPTGAATETTLSSVLSELKKPGTTGARFYNASTAPTGWVEKWRYTVPTGKRATVTSVYLRTQPTTAVGNVQVMIEVRLAGGTQPAVICMGHSRTDIWEVISVGCAIEMREGDYIRCAIYNADTVSRWISAGCTYFEQSA